MNKLAILLGAAAFAVLAGWLAWGNGGLEQELPKENANTLSSPTLSTPRGLGLRYDEKAYGLATTPEQILVKSFIPPCDEGFDYCIYLTGEEFAGTNFESAGLRVEERPELREQEECIMTSPRGYANLAPSLRYVGEGFATSIFTPIEGAATGHYTKGALYRLSFPPEEDRPSAGETTCYEFEARVGASQLANYPPGGIVEFTEAEWARVYDGLIDVLAMTSIADGTKAIFPVP